MVVLGYTIFFFAPTNTMLFIGIAGVLLFVGQAFIQIMMLMFLTDSVEYGECKFKKRNDSVTLSLQVQQFLLCLLVFFEEIKPY